VSDDLETRVSKILAVAWERDEPGFSVEHEPAWTRRMKAAIAQVFFLGTDIGWDKRQAALEEETREEVSGHGGESEVPAPAGGE